MWQCLLELMSPLEPRPKKLFVPIPRELLEDRLDVLPFSTAMSVSTSLPAEVQSTVPPRMYEEERERKSGLSQARLLRVRSSSSCNTFSGCLAYWCTVEKLVGQPPSESKPPSSMCSPV
eukprot:CAMPEP_0194539318 /NCGR_PEP_ID=MMETSP0253-20130528/79237_1 /TAXON_ID=2966 /ORGANISM="Noctiluca scintillans" /LENGTH=118 /DNA_ID=CAMNT_0039385587 /DNA_START=331 /DNA_END=687 /DNA_ORIENTATION=+